METPKGEERPSPPPRPVGRSPGDRPKVGPRVATKPQPALPKRPPVASKPTTSVTNGVQPDFGLPTFPKTAPPLPSLPPCAVQREGPKQPPVPAPRRLSQVLPEQATLEVAVADPGPQETDNPGGSIQQETPPEQTEQQSDTPKEDELIENSVRDTELQEPAQGVDTSVSESPIGIMNESVPKPVASAPPRPKPPVKPAVKPKPKVMNKPRRTSTSAIHKDNTSETVKVTETPQLKTVEVAETKGENNQCDSRTEMCAQDVESKLTTEDKTSTDRVDPPLETSHNTEDSKENATQNGTVVNQVNTPPMKGSESSVSLAESGPCETPTRPPRKKRMSKSFSQGSITAGSNENLSASPASSKQSKQSEKVLQKQDNIDASSTQPIIQLEHSPKLKRRPSRKAPAPPPLSVPRESAELEDALSSKPNEPETNTKPSPAPADHNVSKSTEKTVPIKSEQGKKSRDSSPQPGKLNIRNLEASMGLSIGKGMQHQMSAKTRPKTKPKPPLLSPKPKLIKPQGEEEATLENRTSDGSSDTSGKFSRNPSYSQAVVSPTSPKDKPDEIAAKTEETDKKFKRTPSYSRALDDLEPANKRDSVNLAGVTVTSSTDAKVLDSANDEASQKTKKSSIPGMVRVLPPGLDLSKVRMQKKEDSDKTSSQVSGQATTPTGKRNRLRSRTLDDNEIDPEAGIKRSQTVEALLDVKAEDKMDSCRGATMTKASSAGDILNNKTGSLREGKPNFVPPPPPPYSDLELAAKSKAMQCPSPKEDGSNKRSRGHSAELDDQVFVQDDVKGKDSTSDTDDDYEPIEISREFDLGDDDSDDPDHIYEPIPALPPKRRPSEASNNIDIPPTRPPKRPRALRQAPPPPPALSPPTTPMSPQEGMNFGTPPLPPRARRPGIVAGSSPILSRSPSDMYDTDGYLEPLRKPQTDDVYSYADVPDYPFEKKKTVKEKRPPARKPPTPKERSPEPMPRAADKKNENRESMASITSVRTSGGSHIYEPIGSALGSLTRENPSTVVPEQRVSGRSVFYVGVEDGEGNSVTEQDGIQPPSTQNTQTPARDRKASVAESPQEVLDKEAQEQQDLDTPIPVPQAPPRLKRLQTKADSLDSPSPVRRSTSETSDSSDDYIYPDNPDMISPENSMYQKEGEKEEGSGKTEEEEGFYHEADQQDESIYHEADEPPVGIDEPLYNEADDSAVDCHSGSTSGVASPSSPAPPVPPRDHHKSEPVPQAIRAALNLQRQASALSDTNIILDKKLKLVPKTVSFESQLTDSAFSLSPSSEVTSPADPPVQRFKQRSLSNPTVGQIVKNDDSFQEDSNSNSSDRPSSWASSGDGYDDPLYPRRPRKKADDSVSVSSSIHPGSMVFSHGSGSSLNSDPSDLSDNELEEYLKEKTDKRKRKIHNIAREIMTSEETFVDILKLLNIDFRLAMAQATEAHEHTVVPPTVMNQILQYLPQVQNFNEELLGDLKERINNWENNPRVGDIFIRKGPFLKMYTFYIREFENSMAALDEARRKYPEFDTAVKAFEASPRCKNLLLKHYMLKPIQRIPQYRLLLQEYQKYLTPEHSDYKDTQAALVIVSEVADNANQSMKYGDNFKKLWEIQSSLIGQFEVIKPGREFIKEGILQKLSRKVMQPRMFFLFSDVLLYTTPVSGGYKLNNHIPLSGVRVSLPTKEDFQNELSILSTQRSFTISASTAQERDEWLATLQTAIKDNAKRRSSFDVRKLHKIPSVLVEVEKDLTLGTRAPVWVPDARVSMCMLCTAEFHVTFRRHHCRACGKVVCGYCSDYRAPLRYLKYKAARVCVECYRKLSKEFDQDGVPDLQAVAEEAEKDSPFSRSNIKARFRGITWGSYRKANKAKRPAVLQVSANDDLTDMSGYLKVWKARKWKKLWFVLKGKALYTFKASEDAAAIESIVLLGYEVQNFDSWFEGVEPSLVFEIRHTGTAAMVFRTESTASRDKWLNAIREATMP